MPIKRLLVANRGEIAARIISTARELDIDTFALCTASDTSHAHYLPRERLIRLESASDYLDISKLGSIAKEHRIDAIHPGYGFLSESAEFAERMWTEAQAAVIGPGSSILRQTGDKLAAKKLAKSCGVPVLPAMDSSTGNVEDIKKFAHKQGLPIMLKAVDGGGGRGIRLVRQEKDLVSATKRAIEESPSKRVFAERAVVDNYRHIEIQIIGDGQGEVRSLLERECSIQRRYQKIVEMAPSTITDRNLRIEVIQAAVKMATRINYSSLGTFEFLVNPISREYWFLEINPRLQVEHTVTESIFMLDLVRIQLQIDQGMPLSKTTIVQSLARTGYTPPNHSIQLRVTAENIHSNWALSIGKIQSFNFPSGNGVRVDTHLVTGHPATVSADFDSLIAKIIVTGPTWEEALSKARRALQDTYIRGIKTNIDLLKVIVASEAFAKGQCDTSWLESNMVSLLKASQEISSQRNTNNSSDESGEDNSSAALSGLSSSTILLRKGDAWSLKLSPLSQESGGTQTQEHHLKLLRVQRNELPGILTADIAHTAPNFQGSSESITKQWQMALNATSASAASIASGASHRRGDPSNANHIIIPFAGKLVEVLVDEDDVIEKGQPVCVIQQMKMELEVRASKGGRVKWIMEVEDGEDVGEGLLAVELEDVNEGNARSRL